MSLEKSSIELTEEDLSKFEWLSLNKDLENDLPRDTGYSKLIRKCSENPFVPIGVLATTAALSYGLWSFRTGKKKMSQLMMRTRVAAQGFTLVAIIAGYMASVNKKE